MVRIRFSAFKPNRPYPYKGILVKTNLRKRIAASFIDLGVLVIIILVNLLIFLKPLPNESITINPWIILSVALFWFVYFIGFETLLGATPGHRLLNLKVLSLERKPIHFIQALKRHLLDLIDYYLFCVPSLISIVHTEKHQRIGDLWAGTMVIDQYDSEQLGFEQNPSSIF